MALPTISGTGRLIADPEITFLPSGVAVCKVAVAFNARKLNKDTNEWEDGDVFYGRGSVWRQEAENVAECLKQGDEVNITGKVKTHSYVDKEGEKKTVTELIIDSIGATLKYATVTVRKMERTSGNDRTVIAAEVVDDPWTANTMRNKTGDFNDEAPF